MDLPLSQGFNTLLVIVDWLNRYVTLLPYVFELDYYFGAGSMADLLVRHIVYKYDALWSIVYDRDV